MAVQLPCRRRELLYCSASSTSPGTTLSAPTWQQQQQHAPCSSGSDHPTVRVCYAVLCCAAAMLRVSGSLQKSGEVMKLVNDTIKLPEMQKTMFEMSKGEGCVCCLAAAGRLVNSRVACFVDSE